MSFGFFQLGSLQIRPNLILAPMSGITNSSFRRLMRQENKEALGLVVTEFISVEGLTRANRQSLQMMNFHPEERPISIQIFGHDINRMVLGAQMVEEVGADVVDINSGCPVPKVVKRGGGCELMRQPQYLAKLLKAVSRGVSIPLTLKIRSGWDINSRNALEIAKIAEENGVSMLTIHGRTRQELYRGQADWDFIAEVAQTVSIPVVGSGDIVDYESAVRSFKAGVSALMIGRQALMNPWIFKNLVAHFQGLSYEQPPAVKTITILETYLALLLETLPEKAVIGRLKQLASQVTRRVPGSANERRALCSVSTIKEFSSFLTGWKDSLLSGSIHQALSDRSHPIHFSSVVNQN